MAEMDGAEGDLNMEAPEEELNEEQDALLHFSKHIEARQALSWEQWTVKEKANYYIDRLFLGFLMIFFLILLVEFGYKTWYVIHVNKIAECVSDSVVFLFSWLFTQERHEELGEL